MDRLFKINYREKEVYLDVKQIVSMPITITLDDRKLYAVLVGTEYFDIGEEQFYNLLQCWQEYLVWETENAEKK